MIPGTHTRRLVSADDLEAFAFNTGRQIEFTADAAFCGPYMAWLSDHRPAQPSEPKAAAA